MKNIDEVLTRGVQQIIPTKNALVDLMKKRKITLYQGFDPTSPSLHLGHFIGIRKLAQFQQLGHKVIFLIGDFTGLIGDPTDKSAARKKQTREEVLENLKNYKTQVERVIDFEGSNAAEIRFNSDWLSKLTFGDIVTLSSNFTVQQLIERDMFQNRIKDEKPIYLHEFLYPLMQGYDSVEMEVDLEVGGNDQTFNMLAGRHLLKYLKKKEKFVLSIKLLTDASGKKMGKTDGNAINLTDSAVDIYGKIMSWPDGLIASGIELLTNFPMVILKEGGPLNTKKKLAFDVIEQVHGKKEAELAQKYFEDTFQKNEPEYNIEITKQENLTKTISQIESVGTSSEGKRLAVQGAVDVNGITIFDPKYKIKSGDRIKVGKRSFVIVK